MSKSKQKWRKKLKRGAEQPAGAPASSDSKAPAVSDDPRSEQPVPPPSDPLERFAIPLSILFFVVILAVYTTTLYPSLPGGDSGELIVAAHELGVAHPPGYPLFTMLAKLSMLNPFGSIAWRVNFMSALFGALAAALLFRVTWTIAGSVGAGLFAGGMFAFSPLVWRWAITAEVFSLNDLFLALLILLLVAYEQRPGDGRLFAWFLVFGLGLSNHHTLVLFGAPIAAWLLYRAFGAGIETTRAVKVVAAFGAGLLPYLYLFLSPAADSHSTWRKITGLGGFFEHLRRKQYGTFQLAATEDRGDLFDGLFAWVAQLPGESLFVGALLVVVTIVLLFRSATGLEGAGLTSVKIVSLATVVYLVVFHSMSNLPLDDPITYDVHSRFWQAPNLVMFLLAGVAFGWLLGRKLRWPPLALAAVALALVGGQLGLHYAAEDQSENRLVDRLLRKTLASLPDDVLVVSAGDLYWSGLRYLQICEGVRPEVRLMDVEIFKAPWMKPLLQARSADVELPGEFYRAPSRRQPGSYNLGELFNANRGRFELYSNALETDGDNSWGAGYTSWPEGAYSRMLPRDQEVDLDLWLAAVEPWTDDTGMELPVNVREGSWESIAWDHYVTARTRAGAQLLSHAVGNPVESKYLHAAGRMLEQAIESGEELAPTVYLNLGIYYYLVREEREDAVERLTRVWSTYLQLAPGDTPQTALVRHVLQDPANATIQIGAR